MYEASAPGRFYSMEFVLDCTVVCCYRFCDACVCIVHLFEFYDQFSWNLEIVVIFGDVRTEFLIGWKKKKE